MITNFDTNKVYLAKGMTSEMYVNATGHLLGTLHNHKISWSFLPLTASPLHIWVRDYMPVQVSKEKLVRFNYSPDYLKDNPEYKPDTSAILSALGIHVINSDIIVDGGNVISCSKKVIMTDKIFRENPHYNHEVLIDTLEQLLEAEIVLIPEDYYDEYGHAAATLTRLYGRDCWLRSTLILTSQNYTTALIPIRVGLISISCMLVITSFFQ